MKNEAPDGYCMGGGEPVSSPKRQVVRCGACRRRLLLSEVHCIGGELLGYKVPPHKPKAKTRRPRPRGDRPARTV